MRRRWLYFPAASSLRAAVLYSVENGSNLEFWVVTPDYQVKVLEIDNGLDVPTTSIGTQVGDSQTFTGSISSNETVFFGSLTHSTPGSSSIVYSLSSTANWNSGGGVRVRTNMSTTQASAIAGSSNTSVTDTDPYFLVVSEFNFSAARIEPVLFSGPAPIGSGSVTIAIVDLLSSGTPTAYEAWISATPSQVFVTIKDDLVSGQFQNLNLITLDASGTTSTVTYSNGDTVTQRGGNWRNNHENFLPESSQSSSVDPCYALYEDDSSVNSASNNLFYGVSLAQDVGGVTLKNHLEGIASPISAVADKIATINSGSCTVNSTLSINISVNSLGQGAVEGIAVY